MDTQEWSHKDIWNKRGGNFLVQVSRHSGSSFGLEGSNRWCVYAYIYPSHPHFSAFEGHNIYQEATGVLPLHGGCTYLEGINYCEDIALIKIGCDYYHLGDERFTHYMDKAAALEVFQDAQELFNWLEQHDVPKE